jgi:hypothetical protein
LCGNPRPLHRDNLVLGDEIGQDRPMPRVCPICKSRALELVRTGDATGFYCKIHGHFKVADAIVVDDHHTRAEWEAALRAAKYKAMEGEWPVIRPGDFFQIAEH